MRTQTSRAALYAKQIIQKLGVKQAALTQAISMSDGRTPSPALVSQILNHNIWPKSESRTVLKQQIRNFLTDVGATESDLLRAFKYDRFDARQRLEARTSKDSESPINDQQHHLPESEMLSQTTKKHFQLFNDPFVNDVQGPADVFMSNEQLYIREAMFHAAKHGGFVAVIGESGAGKTILRRDLIERIARENHAITLIQPRIIDKGRLTAGSICDAIIADVSQERPKQTLEAKGRQIERLLAGSSRAGNSHALVIEEAHDLSIQTLKYLKRFWELEDGFKKLLAIVLVGQPELKNKLDERQNWEAREVIRRCEIAELLPLDRELENYLALKFKRVGKSLDQLFEADAFDAIRKRLTFRRRGSSEALSMLYPLVVNNTVTKALNMAAELGINKVSAELILDE